MYEAIFSLNKIDDSECVISIYNPTEHTNHLYYASTLDFITKLVTNNTNTHFYITNYILDTNNSLLSNNDEIQRYNEALREIGTQNYTIVDINKIALKYGRENIVSNKFWYSYSCPFTKKGQKRAIEAIETARTVNNGGGIKCIALDGDNTLWRGIILEGTAELTAEYEHVQNILLQYRNNGIFLALCSKNREQDVWRFLEECPLKQKHFSASKINFMPKADNVIAVAKELNISPKHILFIDDDDYNLISVKETCGAYTLSSLPAENLAENILSYPLLDYKFLTLEDERRIESFDYVAKNNIAPTFTITTDPNSHRIAQMSVKTNQFNLNKYPLTAEQVKILTEKNKLFACEMFYDIISYGVVAYAILEEDTIQQFVVSCRVFGMGVENILLNELKKNGATKGKINKTEKNKMFHDFYLNNRIEEC
jgi:FkbH-like protein